MTNELRTLDSNIIASLVLDGDMSRLNDRQKVDYYNYRCAQAGLDPAAKPFDLMKFQGKLVLYANAGCAQQLVSIHKLGHTVTARELVDDIYCVFVRVTGQDGRSTENMGAVTVAGLKGEAKANAMMKATTKGIRRAVLAHCGLGMMDEDEVKGQKWSDGAVLMTLDQAVAPDALVVEEAGEEWTDEDIAGAKQALLDFGQILMDLDLEGDEIAGILAKPKATIGDTSINLEKWLNRLTAYHQRTIKNVKAKQGAA